MRARSGLRFALGMLAWLAVAGCASSRAPSTAARAPLPRIERVVVAPLNVGLRPPESLRGSEGEVYVELLRHLQAQDRPVARVDADEARELWDEAFAELEGAGGKPAFHTTAERFARRLSEHTDYDLLVLPSLVLRRATVGGRHASWDGVKRRLPVRYAHLEASALANEVPGAGLWGYRGDVEAASLHLALLGPGGELIHEGIAGLDVVQELRPANGTPGSAPWKLAPRLDAFADAANLREGVALAFEQPLTRNARRE